MQSHDLLFHLAIGSRFENIELVQVVLADALDRLEVEADARHWIDVAVREAVANAIKHGNALDSSKPVEVELNYGDGTLVIEVLDRGAGFDPVLLDSPLDPANLLKPSGRGIFYMRSFMDSIDYSFQEGEGTRVTLRKRIAPESSSIQSDLEEE